MARRIDFLHPRPAPWLGWLLLAAGVAAAAATLRLEREQDAARAGRAELAARRERAAQQERLRRAAARPAPQDPRLAMALAETRRPWLPALQAVESATAPPVYLTVFTIDPIRGRVRLDGEAPDVGQAIGYVERLAAFDALAGARLRSHEPAQDAASGQAVLKFAVEADAETAP